MYKLSSKKIVIGTEIFSGNRNKKYTLSQLKYFFSSLINFRIKKIDTAPSYGNNSSVEKLIGKSIKNKRKNFILCSKFLNRGFSNSNQRLEFLKREFNTTLNNLQTNYLDYYFFHSGENRDFFDDNVWNYLNDLKSKKYIINLGLAFKHKLVKNNSLMQIKNSKNYGINTVTTTLNMFSNESLNKVIPLCKKNKLKVWGRMPLAKGLLSGNYQSINDLGKKDSRLISDKKITKSIIAYSKENNINALKAINWTAKYSDAVIVGFKNLKQLKKIVKT